MSSSKYAYDEKTKTLTIKDGVKEINQFDFFLLHKEEVENVVLPESLEKINRNTFGNFVSLESVNIPKNVSVIEGSTFKNCWSLKSIYIPSSVKIIDSEAFAHCQALEDIYLSEGLEEISMLAFDGCESLRRIEFPSSLKEIGNEAFSNVCFSEEIVLPKNLEHLGIRAFGYGNNAYVPKLSIDKDNLVYEVLDGKFLLTKRDKEVILCTQKADDIVIIPQGVKRIGQCVFENFKMKECVLPDGLDDIGPSAFSRCERLENINLPESVRSVWTSAFFKCSNLKELILPDNLINLGPWVADGSGVEYLHIGKQLEKFSESVVIGAKNLKKISVDNENPHLKTDDEGSMIYSNEVLFRSMKGKVPNAEIKEIARCCFQYAEIDEISIPNSVELIESKAFLNCVNLKKVHIGKGLKDCYGDALMGCDNIQEISVDKGNPYLFDYAKKGVFKKLEEGQRTYSALLVGTKHTIFPRDCEIILENAFAGNNGISKVISECNVQNLNEIQTNLNKSNLTSIFLPKSIRSIGVNAFLDCKNIEEINFKNSNVQELQSAAFKGCENLRKIYFADNSLIMTLCFASQGKEGSKLEEIVMPFNTKMQYGNHRLIETAQKEGMVFKLAYGGKEFEINEKIMHFEGGESLITTNDVYFINEKNELISLPKNFVDEFKKPYNQLERLHEKDLYKAYFWKEHAGQVPPYYIVENLHPNEIPGFYNNRKTWAELVKKFKYNETYELVSLFKICHALGVFAEKEKSEIASKYVEKVLLPSLTSEEMAELFEDFNSYDNLFNPKFALLFMKYFAYLDKEGHFVLDENGNVKVKGKQFLTFYDNANGEEISVLTHLHNDFKKLLDVYPNKQVSNRPQKESNRVYVDEKDIVKAYAFMNYDEDVIRAEKDKFKSLTANILTENNTRKYGEEVFESFVDIVSQNGVTQEQFIKLSEAFRDGIVNFEYASDREKLICGKDDLENKITFELLDKSDALGCVLGVVTDCCQRIGDNGGGCVEYGMKEPNSGFVVFRYEGKIIGQAWTWYDEKSKQLTLDNIEAPKFMIEELEENEYIAEEMAKCLIRLSDEFRQAMGERVEKVTIGLNFNSMGKMLKKNFPIIKKEDANMLSNYEEKLTLCFGPDGVNKAYSDASSNAGQVLIKDYAKEIRQEEEMER